MKFDGTVGDLPKISTMNDLTLVEIALRLSSKSLVAISTR
jgi:hypothetical protein